jgi:predicted secreted protein
MRRIALSLVLALFAATCGGEEEASPLTLTDADSGREVAMESGDEFVVDLESNATTGFSWVIPDAGLPEMVALLSDEYIEPDTDLVGAPGRQVFTFEATDAGAGVLRLEYIRTFEDPPIPDRVVEYIIRVDDAPWPPATVEPPSTTSVSAPPPDTSEPDSGDAEAIQVSALFDGEGPRDATIRGFVVWEAAGARLCDVLLESFPPQCGQMWVVIANADALTVELDEAQGVRWTASPVEIAAHFDGDRLILPGSDSAAVTEPDEELVSAFMAFVAQPGTDAAIAIPLADEVALGLADEIFVTATADGLSDPAAWVIDRDEFRAWAGPFSVLDFAAEPYQITIGAHARCAAPPVPAPEGFGDLRRVSLQPTDATSCLEWWTVDFFVADDGVAEAIILDLFEP